jgi:hypothetical protein
MNPDAKPQSDQSQTRLGDPVLRELFDHLGKLLAKEYVTSLTPNGSPPEERKEQ